MSEYRLSRGMHETPEEGRCAMEWVAWIAGEKHSDAPVCVDRWVAHVARALNDAAPDDVSLQRLRPYLTRTIGTSSDGLSDRRRELLRTWVNEREATGFTFPAVRDHWESALRLLDALLPTVMIELPAEVEARAVEVCSA